ncbi:bestrophin family protein [Thiopseudomonas denitrificans]|uniref:Putative membrane protein n=1 Tax=Thiopseudomonas denitrificans TaxID=1501432 RepID=A0A4R6U689_9GAMM|nr:bestrophin family ion channel [Thiopseudomonas denitrificans]TDQ38554.1 putative membrane protein [Thiopseudomonas denitrificans]
MIIRPNHGFLSLLLAIQGSILPRVMPQILLIAGLGVVGLVLLDYFPGWLPGYSLAPFSILGLMLSLLLGFRNNASYARWWEARQQLGSLLVQARSLARLATSYLDGTPQQQASALRIILLLRGFSRVLLRSLRHPEIRGCLDDLLDGQEAAVVYQSRNPADTLLRMLSTEIATAHRTGLLSDILVTTFEARVTALADIQAACERLHNTPIPFAYMLLVHRTAYIFCFLLPFGLVGSTGTATPFISALVAYAFFGLDALSEELEEPFGERPNQLPLLAIERTLEINMLEALGLPTPEPLQPLNYRLS